MMKKVLLITDVPPCKNYTAGLVLDQLCRFFKEGELACCVILNKDLSPDFSPDLMWVPSIYIDRPIEGWGLKFPGFTKNIGSLVGEIWNEHVKTKPIVEKINLFAQKFQPDLVWCVLQGQTMVRLARPVSKCIGVPLVTMIWDPPGWWMRAHQVNFYTRKKLTDEFRKVLEESTQCFVASEAMSKKYSEDFGARTKFFIPSLDSTLCLPPATKLNDGNKLKIAMAGQLYANEEWGVFLEALDLSGWRIGGRDVEIVLIGEHEQSIIPDKYSQKIIKTGWLSQEDAISACSNADILYCPYWFSHKFKDEASLSFPSKITTYLAAGRPVLLHGPEYASPAKFLKRYDAGFFCHSQEPAEILACICDVVCDMSKYAKITMNGNKAFIENMTIECMEIKFNSFLNAGLL